ncbi:hypothetical protein [Chromobacterium phragmitis]|uniref:hypothetical protein n=1 Tax=Chromobacterium phragmitis TaxID=2202141 RepID=UPI0011AE6FF8|nr:hypothetical protein [Chromobacterium phragmitis]
MDAKIERIIQWLCELMAEKGYSQSDRGADKVVCERNYGETFTIQISQCTASFEPDVFAKLVLEKTHHPCKPGESFPTLTVFIAENGEAYYFVGGQRYGLEPMNFSIVMKL